ncbi:MAG: glycosyltransferase family 1 protein [Alphaproteobacteria bacterium]|nr:glycosyltransferase family 1 protein [Alphaproteobacteria bacterium]
MNPLLATFGTRGDVQPFVALAEGLRAAGHTPTLCIPPDHQPWIEARGLAVVPAGDPYGALMVELNASPGRVFKAIARQIPMQFEALEPLVARADVVVSGSLEYATATLCAQLGRPRRAALLSPFMVPARAHPMPMVPLAGLPPALNAATWWLSDALSRFSMLRPLNTERVRRGLPEVTRASAHLSGDEVLLPFPASLAEVEAPTVRVRQTGPWLLEDDTPLPPEVEAFLAAGPPPVYVGLGSMPGVAGLLPVIADAARQAGLRALVHGAVPAGEGVSPLAGAVSHAALLPRCAAVVHHGGAGTLIAATRAARPQVVLPFVADQHPHGRLVQALGLGCRASRKHHADRLAEALRAALGADPAVLQAQGRAVVSGVADTVALLEADG